MTDNQIANLFKIVADTGNEYTMGRKGRQKQYRPGSRNSDPLRNPESPERKARVKQLRARASMGLWLFD